MGGEGSGRKPDPVKKLLGFNQPSKTGVSDVLYLPNYSGVRDSARKDRPETTETDPVFVAWDKSTGISIASSQITDWGTYINQAVKTTSSPTFANLVITASGDIKPSTDSTTAINIAQADGTDMFSFDTTNKKMTTTNSGISFGSQIRDDLINLYSTIYQIGIRNNELRLAPSSGEVVFDGTGNSVARLRSTQANCYFTIQDNSATNTGYFGTRSGQGFFQGKVAPFRIEIIGGALSSLTASNFLAVKTTEQLRLSYDETNYFSTTISSTGGASFLSTLNSFTFANGKADTDLTFNFTGTTNSGVLTWMEDEDYFKFSDDIFMLGGENIVLDTATGTKIGTATSQLLGFYNATPVNQPDTVADASTQDLTGTDTIDQTKLEADLTSCKNAINAIIDRLQELGLIA